MSGVRPSRVWFLSPAFATLLFFLAQVAMMLGGETSAPRVAGLAASTPLPAGDSRVVQVIQPAELEPVPVPETREALIDLLERQRRVVFDGR
jgi:hypothetical protein